MSQNSPSEASQRLSKRFPTPLGTDGTTTEDARNLIFASLTGIPEDDVIDLPGGWTISRETFYGGPGISILAPTGQGFSAIFEIDLDRYIEFVVWGGPSYAAGIERFPSLLDAAHTYLRRMDGFDAGIRFPCWGDLTPDEYAITDGIDEGWTIADLERIVAEAAGVD